MCARRFAILVFLGAVTWASSGLADEKSDFEKARIAYVKKDYVEANARFEAMLDPKTGTITSPLLIIEARMAWGATKLALGKKDEARALFEQVIRETKSQYSPDELTYPKDVLQEFVDVKNIVNRLAVGENEQRAREERERLARMAADRARLEARVKELDQLASQETVVVLNSRLTPLLPFGIGQFQNGSMALGYFFLATEAAATIASCVLFAPYRWNIDHFNSVMSDPAPLSPSYRINQANQYAAAAQDIRTADFILLGALAATAITGIIQAEFAFKPVVTYTRTRTLPPARSSLRVWPSLSPVMGEGNAIGGATVGLHGSF